MIDDAASIDVLRELLNIGVGRAAGTLEILSGTHVTLKVPDLRIVHNGAELRAFLGSEANLQGVRLEFDGPIQGVSHLVFPGEGARRLVHAVERRGDPGAVLDPFEEATLLEIGNIVLNAVLGSIANALARRLIYSPPSFESIDGPTLENEIGKRGGGIAARAVFDLHDLAAAGELLLFVELTVLEKMVDALTGPMRND